MAFSEIETKRIERKVAAYVERRRPPALIRDQVDLTFRVDGQSVELLEIRPRRDRPDEKIEEAIAKARYLKSRDEWLVYWMRADLKWHKYEPVPSVETLDEFLAVVGRDEYCCFFG
jgi:hypothetical protein